MKRVLLTGGTGFIGGHVLEHLLADGYHVKIPVRTMHKLEPGAANRVDIVRGDLRDPHVVRQAVEGVDTVMHLAAFARAWSKDHRVFEDVNVRVVRMLLEASAREGVGRFVHVSSIVTLPPFRGASVNGRSQLPTPYEITKKAADRLVMNYVRSGGNALIVRPTRVFGPGPLTDANGVTRMIDLYVKGKFRIRLADADVLANYVHVDDVARGMLLAAEHGQAGKSYVLGGENVSLRGFLELISELTDVHRRVLAVSPRIGLLVARVSELSAHLCFTPSLTPGWIRVFLEDRRADIHLAREELGYEPRSLRDGLFETIDWLNARVGS